MTEHVPDRRGIFARAMGADFDLLHPKMQQRFGVGVAAGYACVGRGIMQELRRGPWWTIPFLMLGSARNIMFPERGRLVPFTVENYPYTDAFGRETVTFVRAMNVRRNRRRRFDATMIYSDERGGIVDYLGTHQHLAIDLELSVTEQGGLRLVSKDMRFYEGLIGFTFPKVLSGTAYLQEHYDDERECYVIDLEVRNHRWGPLFGYRGTFNCEFPEATDAPETLKPYREERRE